MWCSNASLHANKISLDSRTITDEGLTFLLFQNYILEQPLRL